MKKRLTLLLQFLVSAGLLAWIFSRPDFRGQAASVLAAADPGWLLAGLVVAGAGAFLGVVRWAVFLRVVGIRIGPWETVRLSFVGLFFNNFMLGAVGGDVVKVVWLAAKGHGRTAALLSVLMDRMSGVFALVACSLGFILAQWEWLSQSATVAGVMKFVFGYLGVVVALLTLSFVISSRGATDRLPARLPGRRWIVEFTGVYMQFVSAWRSTAWAAMISLAILLAYFLTFYCAARAFGVDIPLGRFLALMPAVDIIAALPVSLGGFGVREQLFVTLLGDLGGVPQAVAVLISLAGALLTLAWGLLGLALLPGYRRDTATPP